MSDAPENSNGSKEPTGFIQTKASSDEPESGGVELFRRIRDIDKRQKKRRNWFTRIAALLLLASAGFVFLLLIIIYFPQLLFPDIPYVVHLDFTNAVVLFVWLFLGSSALISGMLCLLRRRFHFALAMAFPSIFILVFPGLISIVLILFADDEFKS